MEVRKKQHSIKESKISRIWEKKEKRERVS